MKIIINKCERNNQIARDEQEKERNDNFKDKLLMSIGENKKFLVNAKQIKTSSTSIDFVKQRHGKVSQDPRR